MKIIMYELLGLVKDGKAPKKIKYGNVKLKYNEGCEDYYPYYGEGLFEYKFGNCKNFLNDEVEIIEEDTKLKKINLNYSVPNAIYDMKALRETLEEIIENQRIHEDRINELIDEVNKLKGEE